MRVGLDRNTGEVLEDWDECAQSLGIIGSTAIRSLVLNRSFGSDIPNLVDKPGNQQSVAKFFTAIGRAYLQWEPGFRLTKVALVSLVPGVAQFSISGVFYPNGHLGDYSNPRGVTAFVDTLGLVQAGG